MYACMSDRDLLHLIMTTRLYGQGQEPLCRMCGMDLNRSEHGWSCHICAVQEAVLKSGQANNKNNLKDLSPGPAQLLAPWIQPPLN